MQVIWKYFYSLKSASEKGTLYQLRHQLNRSNVVVDPSKDFNACDDFFQHIIHSHIVAAAQRMLCMSNLDDIPSGDALDRPEDVWMLPTAERRDVLKKVCKQVVDSFVKFSFNDDQSSNDDHVLKYAQQILSLGCFYLELCDAVKEGDGERVLRCWKYLLPIFLASGRTNYSREVLSMLYQHKYGLSQRCSHELLYGRFINVHGRQGKNIPADLHMEHLNRIAKDAIRGLGANKSEKAIVRVGRTLGTVAPVLQSFDDENDVLSLSGCHNVRQCKKDVAIVAGILHSSNVFHRIPNRLHNTFPQPRDVLHYKSKEDTVQWMCQKLPDVKQSSSMKM